MHAYSLFISFSLKCRLTIAYRVSWKIYCCYIMPEVFLFIKHIGRRKINRSFKQMTQAEKSSVANQFAALTNCVSKEESVNRVKGVVVYVMKCGAARNSFEDT